MERPEVFFTYEWALAVQRAYKSVLHPLFFLAYDEQESLCGITALAHDAKSRCISFLGATTGDYCDFLSAPDCRAEFVDAVLSELQRLALKKWRSRICPRTRPPRPCSPHRLTATAAAVSFGRHMFALRLCWIDWSATRTATLPRPDKNVCGDSPRPWLTKVRFAWSTVEPGMRSPPPYSLFYRPMSQDSWMSGESAIWRTRNGAYFWRNCRSCCRSPNGWS